MTDGMSITKIACDLLQTMPPNQDVTFSPLSIFSCLAMTYAGANGNTAKEMENTLHIQHDNNNVHQILQKIINTIQGSTDQYGYTFRAANRLFFSNNYNLLSEFLQLTKAYYNAEPQGLDYNNATQAAETINTWVENQTANKIKDLIPASGINPLTKLILINALYFKGNWKDKFNKERTRQTDFKVDNKTKIPVQMMSISKKFYYMADRSIGFQMVELPYSYDNLCMYIILPKNVDGINSLSKQINSENLRQWMDKMSNRVEINLSLPRFKITFDTTLSSTLKSLGMRDAFDVSASNFSKMSAANDLYVSEVYHKTFVEVNEEGTEAAAATGVVMMPRCLMPMPPEPMVVDHPFIFMIYDKCSNSILFMGKIYNPKE